MYISVIIPTYNNCTDLAKTLASLADQHIHHEDEYEVIVVDDGSTDDTSSIVEEAKSAIRNLTYVFRARDAKSCRSRTRNMGMQASRGEVLTFLDSGVIVPNDFIAKTAQYYRHRTDRLVLVHYIYGLFVPYDEHISLQYVQVNDLYEDKSSVIHHHEFRDFRESLFEACQYQIQHLAAPWALGWTAALTVHRELAEEVGGFDETFTGWGSEDTDFCYRIYKQGGTFVATKEAYAIHIPHPVEHSADKWERNKLNRIKLHRKAYAFETELYPYFSGVYYIHYLETLSSMILSNILPVYTHHDLLQLSRKVKEGSRSLAIGTDNNSVIATLDPSHLFVLNRAFLNSLPKHFPDKSIHHCFGVDTPFADQYFDVTVVTDYWRCMDHELLALFVQECRRISRTTILLYTEGYQSPVMRGGHVWSDANALLTCLTNLEADYNRTELQQAIAYTITSTSHRDS